MTVYIELLYMKKNKKKSGGWESLFSKKCAEGRGNTTHTSEAYSY